MEARCFVIGGGGDPGEAKGALLRRHPRLLVQAVNTRSASNEFFVEMICAQTLRAASSGALLARKAEIDLLLRIAGTTQISDAISKTGAKRGEPFLIIAAGEGGSMKALRAPAGWRRLSRADLSEAESRRVEQAALLNAARG
jgi:tRNA threonylcarbamoyladenosine modification (KEOPS) complex Cgi121 subunit